MSATKFVHTNDASDNVSVRVCLSVTSIMKTLLNILLQLCQHLQVILLLDFKVIKFQDKLN